MDPPEEQNDISEPAVSDDLPTFLQQVLVLRNPKYHQEQVLLLAKSPLEGVPDEICHQILASTGNQKQYDAMKEKVFLRFVAVCRLAKTNDNILGRLDI